MTYLQFIDGFPVFQQTNAAVSGIALDEAQAAEVRAALDEGKSIVADGAGYAIVTPPPPTEAEVLAAWRAKASTTRRAFCIACRKAGILTAPDAIAAAKGEWPAGMTAILDTMTASDAADAQVTWAAVQQVDRLDPLILAMQQFLGLTDAQVDGLFA